MSRLLSLSVRELLDAAASEAPTPGGGSVAALVGALAAAVVEMAARASTGWTEAGAVVAQAAALRRRLEELAPANDEAYEHAIAALGAPTGRSQEQRDWMLSSSLDRAAALPLAVAEAASCVAELASVVADAGDPQWRADAAAAAMLALGATRAAAHLVEVNLAVGERDERRVLATKLVRDAAAVAERFRPD